MKQKSVTVRSVPVTSTGAGSAGSSTTITGGTSSTVTLGPTTVTTGAPVVAVKGFRAQLQQMLQGWQAVIPTGSSLSQAGGPLEQASVVAALQSYLGAYTALDAALMTQQSARTTVKQQLTAAEAFYAQLKAALVGFFGAGSPQLAQFGLKPKTARAQLSVEKKAAMVAQMLGTRQLRGTMGKKQTASAPRAGPVTVTLAPASAAASSPAVPAQPAAQSAAPVAAVVAATPAVVPLEAPLSSK